MSAPHVTIYTDGSCSGTNGGWAASLYYADQSLHVGGSERDTTNNRMELTAVIKALELLTTKCNVTIYSDSKYVVTGMNNYLKSWARKGWKTASGEDVKNKDLWKRLFELRELHDVVLAWVKAHNGDPNNETVDSIAQLERRRIEGYAG